MLLTLENINRALKNDNVGIELNSINGIESYRLEREELPDNISSLLNESEAMITSIPYDDEIINIVEPFQKEIKNNLAPIIVITK